MVIIFYNIHFLWINRWNGTNWLIKNPEDLWGKHSLHGVSPYGTIDLMSQMEQTEHLCLFMETMHGQRNKRYMMLTLHQMEAYCYSRSSRTISYNEHFKFITSWKNSVFTQCGLPCMKYDMPFPYNLMIGFFFYTWANGKKCDEIIISHKSTPSLIKTGMEFIEVNPSSPLQSSWVF